MSTRLLTLLLAFGSVVSPAGLAALEACAREVPACCCEADAQPMACGCCEAPVPEPATVPAAPGDRDMAIHPPTAAAPGHGDGALVDACGRAAASPGCSTQVASHPPLRLLLAVLRL